MQANNQPTMAFNEMYSHKLDILTISYGYSQDQQNQ